MNNYSTPNGVNHGLQESGIQPRLYSINNLPSLEDFKKLTTESSSIDHPLASTIESHVPIYHLPNYSSLSPEQLATLQDEWYHILLSGPGVFVAKSLYKDTSQIDDVNKVYSSIIAEEKQASSQRGGHFAGAGANDRIWNSLSKHCLLDAASFIKYYSNP
ncbi:hypothetical protein GGP41_007290 [Bipolaris sorokiniana]|uniref:Uncharacterized protein n=1 Tax=Cochliobolus sativus TaxID=45130 RepID=A0A8H6E1D4_COCSA|nr:hypothetical protein GGP41_007290 [Bipolaris sorokiniana]